MENKDIKREYIVTAKSFDCLEEIYNELETSGGCECIPEREVECCLRRPISRNTHYILTEEEAENLKNDDRISDVILKSELEEIVRRPLYNQFSNDWNKSSVVGSTNKNWGLLRCYNKQQTSNWGSDGTTSISGTIDLTSSGKNVDVIVVDGHIDPAHPEFSKNPDGSGGSRVNQFNWYSLNSLVTGGSAGTYVYTPYIGSTDLTADNNHGMHVAGTVAGNTQGWARDCNIYNISPYSTNPNTNAVLYLFDYIRAFHATKQVNPVTGRKNPTICNNSWGSYYQILKSSISNVRYRGVNQTVLTDSALQSYGLVEFDSTYLYVQAWTDALVADIVDTINDGIILVGAAGNESTRIESPGGIDYDNSITWSGITRFYHRGSWNTSGSNAICVGAISALVNESKATYSNCGPRIDVYSPGSNIVSCVHNASLSGEVSDPRNSQYKLSKYSGTSMASPQVCGILASMLQHFPRMSQAQSLEYLDLFLSKNNQITNTAGGYTDLTSLQGSENKYLSYNNYRPVAGVVTPNDSFFLRKTSGSVWPRSTITFYK